MLKFLTPYLMNNAEWYFNQNMKKVKPVYVVDTDDHESLASGADVEVAVFNSDKTKMTHTSAWHYQSELIEYTEATAKKLQQELDEYWGQGPFVGYGPGGFYIYE